MKRCPECRRDYYDDTLSFCLDDGATLLEGPATDETKTRMLGVTNLNDEPQTAIFNNLTGEAPTRHQIRESEKTAILPKTAIENPPQPQTASTRNTVIAGIIGIMLITALGVGSYWLYGKRANKQIESIAVMPFVNESGNSDVEYLLDGMTETLINSLSQLPRLNVKARSSVFRYKGKEIEPQQIGNELNVQAVLNGRVVQRGQDLIVYLSLVDVRSGDQIWGEQYNRKQADLIKLQSEIAQDVSSKLKTKLSGAEEQKLAKNYTENTEAYQLYLKGRFYWNKRTEENVRKGIEFFQQAVEKDPNYALAFVGLSDSYLLLGIPDAMTGTLSPQESLRKARAAADRALEIDSSLAEAYAARSHVKWKERDWAGAEDDERRSIGLNPNYASAHHFYGINLANLGRHDEGLNEIRRAQELDPLSLPINANIGYVLYFARRYDEAIEQCKKTLDMDANFALTHHRLGLAYEQKGMYRETIAEFQQAVNNSNRSPLAVASLGHAYAVSGNNAEARQVLSEMKALLERRYVSTYGIAIIHVGLGEKEQALQWLAKANEERNIELVWMKVDPRLDPLRDDPRFEELLRKVGFPQ
jgi:eukaryotic-like serine/threonine-protein kinase